MKLRYPAALILSTAVVGCANMDPNALMSAGSSAYTAASLSDSDIVELSNAACQESDSQNRIAPASSAQAKRLDRIMKGFGPITLNGQSANYKVYMTEDVNAWAMGNGCIRVYAGLMEMMNDDELRGVIGHEMGHVALGHSKNAMRTAYAVNAARTAASGSGNSTVSALSQSELGAMTESLINAQFSQSQELAADDYSFDLLGQKGMKQQGLVTSFQKLAELDGGESSMFSSHPSSPERARRLQERMAK